MIVLTGEGGRSGRASIAEEGIVGVDLFLGGGGSFENWKFILWSPIARIEFVKEEAD